MVETFEDKRSMRPSASVSRPPPPAAVDVPDAVLVLGAATISPGVPGPALRRRVEYGVALFLDCGAGHIVFSGGVVGPPPAEAQVMRDMAVALGVDGGRIVIEDEARNTFENAVYSGRIIREQNWRRVLLVTDSFHLPRAAFIFSRLGIEVEPVGVPREPSLTWASRLRQHIGERLGLIRSAVLFAVGAHKPLVDRVWHQGR